MSDETEKLRAQFEARYMGPENAKRPPPAFDLDSFPQEEEWAGPLEIALAVLIPVAGGTCALMALFRCFGII